MADEVRVRTKRGIVHRAYRDDHGHLATLEADNLDSAEELTVLTAAEASEVEPGDHCERCWPPEPGITA